MGLFLMVIYTPGLLLLVKVESPPSQFENRAFQKRPSFELKKTSLQGIYKAVKSYKKSMEQYIDEKLVVREFFLDLHLGLKSQLFHVNPQPEKVITGVDGWMFGVELDSVLRQTIGQAVLPNKAYSNIDNNIKGVSDYLNEKRKIEYSSAHLYRASRLDLRESFSIAGEAKGVSPAFILLRRVLIPLNHSNILS